MAPGILTPDAKGEGRKSAEASVATTVLAELGSADNPTFPRLQYLHNLLHQIEEHSSNNNTIRNVKTFQPQDFF